MAVSRNTPHRAAFTLIEVMIAVAVMTVGMFGVLSMIPTLSSARDTALQMVIARQVADSVAERIQGTAWGELGGNRSTQVSGAFNYNAWSLPRYTTNSINPPMTEDATDPNNNLLSNGVLAQLTGVPNLKVYLEYYTGAIMTSATDRTSWYAAITGSTGIGNRMTTFTTNGYNSVVVRVLITWKEQNGVPINTHELFIARKQ